MPNVHPMVIHIPIVLLTMGLLLDVVGISSKASQYEYFGRLCQVGGAAGLGLSIFTGLFAKRSVVIPAEGTQFLDIHQQVAFVLIALASSLLLWRLSNRMMLPTKKRALYLFLSVLLVVLLWTGAWYGGELVYRYGVGVKISPM